MILPLARIFERVEVAKNSSDTDYFLSLLYAGEQLTKLVAAGLVACITDDSKRHRYGQVFRLIRADGLGDWSVVIDEVLTGPTSHLFNPVVNNLQRELTERLGVGSWQHQAVSEINECIKQLYPESDETAVRASAKQWFSLFAHLRNKTRGHGADPSQLYSNLCIQLYDSIRLITENYSLFTNIEWAYLHRNLSGKYKVADISKNPNGFYSLKTDRNQNLDNGVHIYLNKPTRVELIESDADLIDFYFPNGGFNNKRYEVLSYISGNKNYQDASQYLTPPGDLPVSETQGLGKLELQSNAFTNLPKIQDSYIKRDELENELKKIIMDDRHPVVTLIGRGGIGKTTLAISVLNELCNESRFNVIIWFSARDIDLLMEGAKPVKPHILTEDDIAKEFIKLIEPKESKEKGFRPKTYFENELTKSSLGPILFIFDNFETVKNPVDLFHWLDTYIRTPNKILITSRTRDFKADYPIEVKGMTHPEFKYLVNSIAENLGIKALLSSQEYLDALYNETDGHPYVVKILLGEIAKEGKTGKVKRIVAGKDEVLTALFERTYNGLTPAAKRVFLTLCNWRSTIPQIAIEAVLMREDNERMDVEEAIEELHKSSLIEISKSEKDGMLFITTPLSAAVFGKKKLSVAAMKSAIEADNRLLHTFGVGLSTDIKLGIEPRIIKFFRDIAKRVSQKGDELQKYIPILEFICRKYPYAWQTLSSLYEEENLNLKAMEALQNFISYSEDEYDRLKCWKKISVFYALQGDWNGEAHALVEICELSITPIEQVRIAVNRINQLFKANKFSLDTSEKQILVQKIVTVFSRRLYADEGLASDFSQLAWLHLHQNQTRNATKAVLQGLKLEPTNTHCLKLKATLNLV